MNVYRITTAHAATIAAHEAAGITARIATAHGIPGATFTPGFGMADAWAADGVEPNITTETAAPEFPGSFIADLLREFGQDAAYVTTNGAAPALVWNSGAVDLIAA